MMAENRFLALIKHRFTLKDFEKAMETTELSLETHKGNHKRIA
jgi:hypothetical protein